MLPEQTSAELEIIDEFIKEEASSRVSRSNAAGRTPILVSRSSNPEPCVRPETFTGPRPSHVMPDVRNFTAPIPEMPPSCSQAELSEMLHTVTLGNPPSNPASGVLVSRSTAPRGHGNWIPSETLQTSRSQHTDIKNNALEAFLQRPTPKLRITEQPKQRGMRFRYECEGRSAGSILGANSTDQNKTLPTIELSDCDGVVEVTVVTCLVWKDWPHRIHPHGLVGKDCHDGICEVTIKPKSNRKHSYNNLGVQCVKKKEIEEAVVKKINMGFDPFHAGHWKNQEEVDMNVVRLCFQASYQNSRGETHHLEPVLSDPIYDKKSTNTSELKICRINKEMGQCAGGEEVYLLCDKVQKEDIAVVFHTESWEAKADFSQADVHRQIAIVFKTPSYQDLDISKPVTVEVCLERVTDKVRSDPFYFTYLPKDHDVYGVDVKRKRGFPDGIGELSSSDPHGIEAKRRKKKPNYKDHCNPVPKAVLLPPSYGLSVESREYQQSFAFCEDNMFQTQPENTFADFIDSSSFANNYFLETNWPSSDHDMPVMNFQESFLDNFEDYGQPQIPFPLLSPPAENTAMNSDAGPPNTASLIANSMFPSQYKEEEFPFSQCLGLQEREELT